MLASCTGRDDRVGAEENEMLDESGRFQNMSAEFVGDAACFDCHEQQYRGYEEHGMAQSVYPLTAQNVVEDFVDVEVYDDKRDFYYTAYGRGGRYYQEEYRTDSAGTRTHSLIREMRYVMGSGSAARTYLAEVNDRYYELPLTWYTQERRWAFSPGYEDFNPRFDRIIPDRCMTCHNNYPQPVPHAEGKFGSIPHGIGCERCHGPGSVHVNARLSSPEPAGEVDETIVNPAHLTLDRRLDVCQQCHLHTTISVLREGRTAYDYRPSQPLAGYLSLFSLSDARANDQIDVISHADRMKKSACFIETQSTESPMDCLTCHNPHEGFRTAGPEYFNRTCRTCHNPRDLRERISEEARESHGATSNCFECHMPKVRAEGTPHASFTDHWIRVVSRSEGNADRSENGGEVQLEPYFARDRDGEEADIYQGIAYIIYGRQNGHRPSLQKGIELLEKSLGEGNSHGEAHFLLGFAQLQLERVERAIPHLEKSISLNADIPERLNALAQAYEAAQRSPEAIERLYVRAVSIQPALADVRVNYGRFLEAQNRLQEAVEQYRLAAAEQPWLETAHYNLGTAYLRIGRLEEAAESLGEAIHLNPDHVDALGNLGLLLASRGRAAEAKKYFERAVKAAPDNPVALGNLGAYHLNTGNPAAATTLLERAIAADPQYVDGWINLAIAYLNQDNREEARRHAQRALQLSPNNQRAQQILEAL